MSWSPVDVKTTVADRIQMLKSQQANPTRKSAQNVATPKSLSDKGGTTTKADFKINSELLSLIPCKSVEKPQPVANDFSKLWGYLDKKDHKEAHALLEKMVSLKKKGELNFDLNTRNEGVTLIYKAVQSENPRSVQLLIEAGADVNLYSIDDRSQTFLPPLHLISEIVCEKFNGNFDDHNCHAFDHLLTILVSLINAGADLCQIYHSDNTACESISVKIILHIPLEKLIGLKVEYRNILKNLNDLLILGNQTNRSGFLEFQGHYMNLEGHNSEIISPNISKAFSDFLKTLSEKKNTDENEVTDRVTNHLETINRIFKNLNKHFSSEEALKIVQRGEPFPLLVDTIPEKAATAEKLHCLAYLILYDPIARNYILVRINCGDSADQSTTNAATFYRMRNQNPNIFRTELEKLINSSCSAVNSNMLKDRYLTKDLVKNLGLEIFGKVSLEAQTVGNCTMISTLQLLRFTLMLEFYKDSLSQQVDPNDKYNKASYNMAIKETNVFFPKFVKYYFENLRVNLEKRGVAGTVLAPLDNQMMRYKKNDQSCIYEIKVVFTAREFAATCEYFTRKNPDLQESLKNQRNEFELSKLLVNIVLSQTGAKEVFLAEEYGFAIFSTIESFEKFKKLVSVVMKDNKQNAESSFFRRSKVTSCTSEKLLVPFDQFKMIIDDIYGRNRLDVAQAFPDFKNADVYYVTRLLGIKRINIDKSTITFKSIADANHFKMRLKKIQRRKLTTPSIDFSSKRKNPNELSLKRYRTTIEELQLISMIISCAGNNSRNPSLLAVNPPASTKPDQNFAKKVINAIHGELDFEIDENAVLKELLQEMGAISITPLELNKDSSVTKENQKYQVTFLNEEAYQKFLIQLSTPKGDKKASVENKCNEPRPLPITPLKDLQTKTAVSEPNKSSNSSAANLHEANLHRPVPNGKPQAKLQTYLQHIKEKNPRSIAG